MPVNASSIDIFATISYIPRNVLRADVKTVENKKKR